MELANVLELYLYKIEVSSLFDFDDAVTINVFIDFDFTTAIKRLRQYGLFLSSLLIDFFCSKVELKES